MGVQLPQQQFASDHRYPKQIPQSLMVTRMAGGSLCEKFSFGGLSPTEIRKVVDFTSLTTYAPQWSPRPRPKRPSIVFGTIVIEVYDKTSPTPGPDSPVLICPDGHSYVPRRDSGRKRRPKSAPTPSTPFKAEPIKRSAVTPTATKHQAPTTPSPQRNMAPFSSLQTSPAQGLNDQRTAPDTGSKIAIPAPKIMPVTYAERAKSPSKAPTQTPVTSPVKSPVKSLAKLVTSPPTSGQGKVNGRAPSISPTSPTSAGPGPKRWADLIKAGPVPTPNGVSHKPVVPKPSTGNKKTIGEVLGGLTVSYHGNLVHPRGLINSGNMCFLNAILQPLLHCAPFYNAFKELSRQMIHNFKAKQSILASMIMFLDEFREDEPGKKLILPEGDDPDAFAPEYVYTAIRALMHLDSAKGRQEDAQEFLGFILDGLHEEMLQLQRKSQSPQPNGTASDSDSWVEVGRNNKTLETRSTDMPSSPISSIFGGRMRSVVRCSGRKDSITLEPYDTLQLDLAPDSVHTIEDALANLTASEILEGFTTPSKGNKGNATKQTFVESLPPILILHLKRFVYDNAKGAQKLHKHVDYGMELKINSEIMSPSVRQKAQQQYRLFAVVYHHGRLAAGGHYTCDVQRQTGEWIRMDDAAMAVVSPQDVLQEKKDRAAYMLFYCRA
ncbi:hypothetical protein PhCBS80983_g03456 [Powellomyces hirtus]|uniref:Ubiquitin carboxyl-terminal hydrolase n=1 Tax=Powellomyces hirtus TaxID=109895 RepID=A0A507E3I7_9FUNG|nr:hypothetical protein PhCBS80983_g03456 [Powellomyces hirtus]